MRAIIVAIALALSGCAGPIKTREIFFHIDRSMSNVRVDVVYPRSPRQLNTFTELAARRCGLTSRDGWVVRSARCASSVGPGWIKSLAKHC